VDERKRLYWPFIDPALTEGSEEEQLAVFREVRDAMQGKISAWLEIAE
jgi:arsenate reductase